MGATHSSQHTVPDAEHSSTHCCPTHEMWELPTPLIVAKRSQQGDEVYGGYPLVLKTGILLIDNNTIKASHNSNEAYTAASIITHAQSKTVKQAHIRTSILLSYNYNNEVPSNIDLTPARPNIDTSSGKLAQKLRIGSYELNQVCPTLLTQQKALSKAQEGRCLCTPLQLHASFQKQYQTKRLSKRSLALPPLLPSELSIGVEITTLLATRAWIRPVSRGNRHFTVDCGRQRQSGPRPETGFLRQPALEGLTRSARTNSPRQDWPEQFPAKRSGSGA
ncbi:hypothetical protein F511_09428 [Dorcoceras hygrometricum]|uniref:Uncharacterized protein n=1 Tax=Dorcoceras hygrometricum TaxID=472368 RepID=A0A2Z7C453_9LAMI|nr:hypothetical protein F511_09428 [Dorcoceras hygrometricum]